VILVGIVKDPDQPCDFNHKVASFARYTFPGRFTYVDLVKGEGLSELKGMAEKIVKEGEERAKTPKEGSKRADSSRNKGKADEKAEEIEDIIDKKKLEEKKVPPKEPEKVAPKVPEKTPPKAQEKAKTPDLKKDGKSGKKEDDDDYEYYYEEDFE